MKNGIEETLASVKFREFYCQRSFSSIIDNWKVRIKYSEAYFHAWGKVNDRKYVLFRTFLWKRNALLFGLFKSIA